MADANKLKQYRFCSTCGHEHSVGVRFCGRCGSALCIQCGATARQGAKFCLRCGRSRNQATTPPANTPRQPLTSFNGPLPMSRPLHPVDATDPSVVEFVNRQDALSSFQRLIDGTLDSRRILLLRGPNGMGKTFLLQHMRSRCKQAGIRHVWMNLVSDRGTDYLRIMRDIRDSLGKAEFESFTKRVNEFTTEENTYNINIKTEGANQDSSAGGKITLQDNSSVSDSIMAGRDAYKIDLKLSTPRHDIEIDPWRMQEALTDSFKEALAPIISRQKVVFLFDNIDRLEPKTAEWLWRDILLEMTNTPGFSVVVTCEKPPEIDRSTMQEASLDDLLMSHVVEYLGRRGVPEEYRIGVAAIIVTKFEGKPKQMADLVDYFMGKYGRGATP